MSAYNVVQDGSRSLVVHAPSSILMNLWAFALIGALAFLIVWRAGVSLRKQDERFRREAPRHVSKDIEPTIRRLHRVGLSIFVGCMVLWSIFTYSSGSIELDRAKGTAAMRAKQTMFLPAQTAEVPLARVTGAVLDTKPNARRIRLLTSSGEDLAYPIWSDRKGQDEALKAINDFLGKGAAR